MLDRLSDEEIMREYSIKNIVRYNTRLRIKDESVSDHTCFVALFSLKILDQLHISDAEICKSVLIIALLHDIPESITSDIPYDIKRNNPELKLTLRELENDYYINYWPSYKSSLEVKSGLPEAIVKLADTYSVYQYTMNEITLGNKSPEMIEIFENVKIRIDKAIEKINKILVEENYEI